MPVHIIASMIGHVLRMYKDYIVTHAQCLPRAMNLPGHKHFGRCQLDRSSFLKLYIYYLHFPIYGRCEWVVGYVYP